MVNFNIEGSKDSPAVYIDRRRGTVEISGNSTLENPTGFYKQLAKWIHAFTRGKDPVNTIIIQVEKANARSLKWIKFILHDVEKSSLKNNEKIKINWIH